MKWTVLTRKTIGRNLDEYRASANDVRRYRWPALVGEQIEKTLFAVMAEARVNRERWR